MEFGNVLANLRIIKGISQRELAKALGVSNGAIAMWETNKRQPDLEMLKKIASYFDVTVDFIIGNEKSNCDTFADFQLFEDSFDLKERIRKLMSEQSITEDEFMLKTGFDKQTKDLYLYSERIPTLEHLIKISGALNVSIDYLLDMSKRKRITTEEELLLQSFNKCNDECKRYLLAKANVLSVEGFSGVAAAENQKQPDSPGKSLPSNGTEGKSMVG